MSWGLNSKVTVFVETELCSSEYIKALKQGRRSEATSILSRLRQREISAREVSHVFRKTEMGGMWNKQMLHTSQAGRGRKVLP